MECSSISINSSSGSAYDCEGYRLPTEAEWEYAARAGTDLVYTGSNTVGDVAWYGSNSGDTTHESATRDPNIWGLYDMSGNVWEWTWDWYGSDYYSSSPSTDPEGPSSGSDRVCRGGSYHDLGSTPRVSDRGRHDSSGADVGFRIARTIPVDSDGDDDSGDDDSGGVASRFQACADGVTVADNDTGLLWERKTGTPQLGVDGVVCSGAGSCPDPHDVDNRYHWSAGGSAADGNAYTDFLATLNSAPGFAGEADWRLPEISELQSIVIGPAVSSNGNTNPTGQTTTCSVNPCVDPDFAAVGGETWPSNYWSATTDPVDASKALLAAFFYAPTQFWESKANHMFVRAVRTGHCAP